jgi:hypothetical protein
MSARLIPVSGSMPFEKETKMMTNFANKHSDNGAKTLAARTLSAFLAVVLLGLTIGASAQAAAPAITLRTDFPDTALAGEGFLPTFWVENSGTAQMSGPVTLTLEMPDGLTVLNGVSKIETSPSTGEFLIGQIQPPETGSCEVVGPTVTCTMEGAALRPAGQEGVKVPMLVAEDASGELDLSIEVSGGGVADQVQRREPVKVEPPESFDVESFTAKLSDVNESAELQAGASPGSAGNAFEIPTFAKMLFHPQEFSIPGYTVNSAGSWFNFTPEHVRNVVAHTPAGMVANFGATPVRCTTAQLNSGDVKKSCPVESQIGVAHVAGIIAPVYSMVPPPGTPAQFGFQVVGVPILINAHIRASDFGVDLVSENTSSSIAISKLDVRLWGVPADSSHDAQRGLCLYGENGNATNFESDGLCETDAPRKAFLRMPTSCTGPLQWGIDIDTYEHPGVYHSRTTTTPAQVGCNQLGFTPSIEAKPSTNVGDSPSGLSLKLHLPQNENPDSLAEAHLKDLTLRLPQGLTVNSGSADGLGACSPAQIGLQTAAGQLPAHFDDAQPTCPDASKIGAVRVDTPAIDHPLPGSVYLASQQQNPFGSLLALYVVVNDPDTGVIIKLPVRADLDPETGRLTTVVSDSPQLPFEDFTVELDKGAHAPLRTPVACGRFTTTADMTPWSSPEGQDAHPSGSFELTKGAGGGSCVGSAAQAPFDPTVTAGTLDPTAGAFSPFVLKINREDGTQELGAIEVNLPKGLLASLRGIPYCSDAVLASIPTELGTGNHEVAHSSCPAASQVGSASVAVGVGPSPLNVNTGKAYWAGPYKGAPVSMAVVFPAVAGPFDLGNVVVRTPFYVDPETAQITAKSDPLPRILAGIPLDVRSLRVDLDRPHYTLNPTSCDPMSFQTKVHSTAGTSVDRSQRFQVGGCANLPFKPKLGLRLKGGSTRGKYPALTANVTFPKAGGANVATASVALPHSEFLAQNHIRTICTRVQFAADQCPSGSIYGSARAYSPLLDNFLEGPVYLRSSSHELPDLVADLQGQIEIALVGRIDSTKDGGIRTTFESVPDAPVSKFTLRMKGGKKGLLQNSTNICRRKHRATALFEGQNGKTASLRPVLKVASCPKRGHKKNHHQKHRG